MQFEIGHHSSIFDVSAEDWNALAGQETFLRHEFLAALERSGCVGAETAWQPAHLTLAGPDGRMLGALPLYLKHDSMGEFVFDWSWADAYERSGLPYYPKLVSSVPFTPATGKRLLTHPAAAAAGAEKALIDAARELATALGVSSVHVLFPTDGQQKHFSAAGFLTRKHCQFHWHNDGYRSFDDFLARFNAAKRKKARRERRRIAEAGVTFEHLPGDAVTDEDWDAVFDFYSRTFLRRGRLPYLNRAFFDDIARTLPGKMVVIVARYQGRPIATAICFRDDDTLYGRYWGAAADFHSLHFETCYYQGIEYCIGEKLQRFEPGTQGEHKIARGFTPRATWSNHWLSNTEFSHAVARFLEREQLHVDAYIRELNEHVPYRAGAVPATVA